MKIQLDYDNKTVSIEDNVDLGDFVDKIRKILPDWREWKLETKTEIIWSQPTVIREHPWRIPWYTEPTWVTTSDHSGDQIFDVRGKVQFEL